MAHAGNPTGLAQQQSTSTLNGLWQAVLAAVVLVALVAGMVFVGTSIAAKGSAVPAADRSYDQIEQLRGGIVLAPAVHYPDVSYEQNRMVLAPAVHYPDVSYDQNRIVAPVTSGTAPYAHPGQIKGHRGAMIDQ